MKLALLAATVAVLVYVAQPAPLETITVYAIPGSANGQDSEVYIPLGTANGETTYLDQIYKSVYTIQSAGHTQTLTSTTETLYGTLIASASGFKASQDVSGTAGDGGFVSCTIDGRGGAGCVLVAALNSQTLTVTHTGSASPILLTISESSSTPTTTTMATTTTPGQVSTSAPPTSTTAGSTTANPVETAKGNHAFRYVLGYRFYGLTVIIALSLLI